MSDAREAAGRLRRVQTYGGQEMPLRVYRPKWGAPFERDKNELVRAYLAEHAADDDEPITLAWWQTLKDDPGELYFLHFGDEDRFWLDFSDSRNVVTLDSPRDSTDLLHIKTRGQLRRLCQALGIPLQPIGQEQGK